MAIDAKFRELELSMWKAFDRKYSSCIRLCNKTMTNWFRHHLENFISFPLIYRFAGIRRVELEADNWKHRSNYTVTLSMTLARQLCQTSCRVLSFHATFALCGRKPYLVSGALNENMADQQPVKLDCNSTQETTPRHSLVTNLCCATQLWLGVVSNFELQSCYCRT